MNREFLKMQKIAGLITENQYRQLIENTDNPTHMSKVDWYYIGDASDYPGPKGRVVPKAKGYDDPSQFEDTELYIPVGTEGWIDRDDFMDEEENRVPYKGYEEYFGSVSGEDPDEGEDIEPRDSGIPLTDEVEQYIDNFIDNIVPDDDLTDLEHLDNVGFWEQDFEETLTVEFGETYNAYSISPEVREYIRQRIDRALYGD